MFNITLGKGFRMTFQNGYSISVQWGVGNYCDNRHEKNDYHIKFPNWKSASAEIAIFDKNDNFHRPESWSDDVLGWQKADEVLFWMNYTSNLFAQEQKEMLVLYRQGFIVMYYYDENMELHHSFYIDDLDEWVDASTEYKTPQEVVHDLKLIGSKDQIICYNLSTINN